MWFFWVFPQVVYTNLLYFLCSPTLKHDLHQEKQAGIGDTQQINTLSSKPDDQSSIPERTH